MTTYRVVITREDGNWLASSPDVPGAHTWARSLSAVELEIREAIAGVLDLPAGAESSLDLALDIRLGDRALEREARALRDARARLARAERDLAERTQRVAQTLVSDRDMTARDAAVLLAISPQRVNQLAPKQRTTS
jgi:predicted RNase H-like HicB family nuclease